MALAGAYLANTYTVLALRTFRRILDRWPEHEHASEAREAVADLEGSRGNLLAELNLFREGGEEIAALHEEARAVLESGDYRQAAVRFSTTWRRSLRTVRGRPRRLSATGSEPDAAPGFDLARDNLADLRKAVGERHAPWPFPFQQWATRNAVEDLAVQVETVADPGSGERLAVAIHRYLRKHPEVERLVPLLLDRGNTVAREFALRTASMVKTPERSPRFETSH